MPKIKVYRHSLPSYFLVNFNYYLITLFILSFNCGVNYNCGVYSKQLSSRRHIFRDGLRAQESLKSLKKIFVDIETDVVSAIAPLTFQGTKYPWRILSPALAQAQHRALQEQDRLIQRRSDGKNDLLLLSSDLNQVKFLVYQDHHNPTNYINLKLHEGLAPYTQGIYQIHPSTQVKILIHGFQSGPALPFVLEAKNAYLEKTNHTVIVVDWEDLSLPKGTLSLLLYPAVTTNALKVGEKVADLISYLLENRVILDLAQVHIIGHSLGAHAAGNAGSLIAAKYGHKIGRITALDAAFLAFLGPESKHRIDKDDARFVDAIHTSGIGVYDPIGHVDFYPNGGRNQVSCYDREEYQGNGRSDTNQGLSRTFEKIIQSCSHARAYHYFIKTISRENVYWACKCVNWRDYRQNCRDACTHRERMGEYVSLTASGKYYLEIDAQV